MYLHVEEDTPCSLDFFEKKKKTKKTAVYKEYYLLKY